MAHMRGRSDLPFISKRRTIKCEFENRRQEVVDELLGWTEDVALSICEYTIDTAVYLAKHQCAIFSDISGPWFTYKMVIPDFFVIPMYSAEVKLVQSENRTRLGLCAALVISLISFLSLLIKWNGVGSFFFGLLRRFHLIPCLWIHRYSLNLPDVYRSV